MKPKNRIYNSNFHIPSFEETLANFEKEANSEYDLRLLGTGTRELKIREEDRYVNMQILGTPGMGKSMYLYHHIKEDIDSGLGLCLIDPSDFGATYNAVLDYCVSIKHKRVCIIDPSNLFDFGAGACISVLDENSIIRSADSLKDAINNLLSTSTVSTPVIQGNMDTFFRMLAAEGLTLHEAAYFTDYDKPEWKIILNNSKSHYAEIIRKKFENKATFTKEFGTTVTRLSKFSDPPISLMLGADKGLNFVKMVDEGWIILCNVVPGFHLNSQMSTFLGILVISQIIQALDKLNHSNRGKWGEKNSFYLYIDEAGSFITDQIATVLRNKRKSGLRMVIAHHDYESFKGNTDVLSAVNANTKIKVMFNSSQKDCQEMMKWMKMENPSAAAHTYGNLPKRHAVIKNNQEYPIETKTPDVQIPFVSESDRNTYIRGILQTSGYWGWADIKNQIKSRIKSVDNINDTAPNDTSPSVETTAPDSKTNRHTSQPKRKSLFDLKGETEEFIRNNANSKKNGKGQTDSD